MLRAVYGPLPRLLLPVTTQKQVTLFTLCLWVPSTKKAAINADANADPATSRYTQRGADTFVSVCVCV